MKVETKFNIGDRVADTTMLIDREPAKGVVCYIKTETLRNESIHVGYMVEYDCGWSPRIVNENDLRKE